MSMMNVLQSEDEVTSLLHQIDPFNNQRHTYSEVVHLLSSYTVPKDALAAPNTTKIPLLEKFINQERAAEGEGQEINYTNPVDDLQFNQELNGDNHNELQQNN